MRILVTGTTGWLGGTLAEKLATNATNHVVGLARRFTSIQNVKIIQADITSKEDMDKLSKMKRQDGQPPFDVVVHLAGAAGWCSLEDGLHINVAGTRNLLQACRTAGTTKFIIASSVAVTGTTSPHYPPKALPITNDHGFVGSKWPYALSKHMVEETVKFMSKTDSGDADYLMVRIGGVVSDPPGPLKHLETAVGEEWTVDAATIKTNDNGNDNDNDSKTESSHKETETTFPEFPLCAIALSDITRCFMLAVKAPIKPGVRTITAVGPSAYTKDSVPQVMASWYPDKYKEIDMTHHSKPGNEFDPIYETESAKTEIGFEAQIDLRKECL